MQRKKTERMFPTLAAVEAEAARIETMIAATTRRLESSQCNLRTFMHLQVCRAELQAYFAGLLYGLGYTDLLDTKQVDGELNLPEIATMDDPFLPVLEDGEEVRYVQCYEC